MPDDGEFYFLVKPHMRGEFVAFAKRVPFVADAHFAYEPDDMWFEFGATEEEALRNLKRSLLN